jgi:putative membrane protein
MNHDFSKPQKQSPLGIIILFGNTFQKSIRALIVPSVFILIKLKGTDILYILLGLSIILLTLAISAYLRYQNFTFFLDDEKQEFVINEGVLNKTTLTIQLSKIQNVNIKQSFIQQIIKVYSLEIDTAGSEKKEASIKAIDHKAATLLKQKLLNRTYKAGIDQEILQNDAVPFSKLSNATLLKVGITSNYGASILLLTGFLFALFQMLNDYNKAYEDDAEKISLKLEQGLSLFSLCVLVSGILIVIVATNIIRTFVRYFNFEIIRQKNALAIASGLFTKNNTLLKPGKVQLSAYSQNYFQRKFDIVNMKIKQASQNNDYEKEHKKFNLEIPGCDAQERDEILKMIYDRIPATGTEYMPDYRFILLQVITYIITPVAIFTVLSVFAVPLLKAYLVLIIPYVITVFILLYFEYKHHRLFADGNFIIKKRGIWDVEYEIIEPHKIQAITAKQFFWHKKANVGHLILHTAAGKIYFSYGNYTDILKMINYWIYQVETSKKDWM